MSPSALYRGTCAGRLEVSGTLLLPGRLSLRLNMEVRAGRRPTTVAREHSVLPKGRLLRPGAC